MASIDKGPKKRSSLETSKKTRVAAKGQKVAAVKTVAVSGVKTAVKDTPVSGVQKAENSTKSGISPGAGKARPPQSKVAVPNGKIQRHTNGTVPTEKSVTGIISKQTAQANSKAVGSALGMLPPRQKSPTKFAPRDSSKAVVRVQAAEQDNLQEVSSDDLLVPVVETVKPANQVQLSAKELAEEHGRVLNAARPGPSRVILRYNLEDRCYKPEPQLDQVLLHYTGEGNLLHREGGEGQALLKAYAAEDERLATAASLANADTDASGSGKRLRNQFNFSERGIQTTFYPPRERGTNTEVPESAEASGTCSPWEIYDAYVADQEQQKQQQEEANKQKGPSKGPATDNLGPVETAQSTKSIGVMHSGALQKSLCLVERMSTENNFMDIILDFKFWEDEADVIKLEEGTLLPLWQFSSSMTSLKQVTGVSWSSTYPDLFVAAFGSFDFQKQSVGHVAGFSLKNAMHPEFHVRTASGVMSLHMNPHTPNLLAVGCYDGSVAVFDVRDRHNAPPIFCSTPKTGCHSRPVWAVEWVADQTGAAHTFYSLSSEGRLLLWTLATAELTCQELLKRTQQPSAMQFPDKEPSQPILAAASCMDFHPEQDFLVLIGTGEGAVYKCNTANKAGHMLAYEGHAMSVYSVRWNRVHPATFLSASADWTVKLWHSDNAKALMSFALGSPVGDVAWSPFSATTFAAVTEDGLTRVFDLHQNTAEPLCEQKVVAKAGLTRLAFNPKYPVLLVGDNRSHLAVLKLSPNLRKTASSSVHSGRVEAEQARLDKVLEIAEKRSQAVQRALQTATSI